MIIENVHTESTITSASNATNQMILAYGTNVYERKKGKSGQVEVVEAKKALEYSNEIHQTSDCRDEDF